MSVNFSHHLNLSWRRLLSEGSDLKFSPRSASLERRSITIFPTDATDIFSLYPLCPTDQNIQELLKQTSHQRPLFTLI